MNEKVRILHIISGMGNGGAETFLMNMYRHMDHAKIRFDFLLASDENAFRDELEEYGSRIFKVTKYTHNPIRNAIETAAFFKEHQYSVIHVHANSLMNIIPLICAKRAGAPCRIMHSHSTRVIHKAFYLLHWLNKIFLNGLATEKIACSEDAGRWMFRGEFKVIKNAIDVSNFHFDREARRTIRASLGIKDETLVIGHVGRFFPAKNHPFILDVFQSILRLNSNAVLILVGDGGREETVHQWVEQRGISDHVCFLGMRKDVNKVLSAFDAFLFPSIYEGFGIAAIEAQANGLQVFCSDCIPKDVNVTPCAHRLPLEAGPEEWAKKILSADLTRQDVMRAIISAGFDIHDEARKLQDFYISQAEDRRQ